MGFALADGGAKFAIGTTIQVWEFRDVPDVARRLEPVGTHDACYLPRSSHVTGNVQIHEMAYGAGQLWFVNTRFSCLATIDPESSFEPRWRPPFVTELEPSDRCHLNGLAMVDGKPKYVTALGESNEMAGWRATADLQTAFTLTRTRLPNGAPGGNATIGTISVATTTNGSGDTLAMLTFSGTNTEGGSLADGIWTLNINHNQVVSNGATMSSAITRRIF